MLTELEEKVIDFFTTNNKNSAKNIAKTFNISEHKANRIIDEYLASKKK